MSATAGELDLSATWDALDGATSYQVAWREADGDFEAANAATVSDTSATITVSGYGRWVLQLQGCNDAGCGPGVTQTVGIAPGAPANLQVNATAGKLDLSATWDALDGATSYQLAWRPADGAFEAGQRRKGHRHRRQHHRVGLRQLAGATAGVQRRGLRACHHRAGGGGTAAG